MNRNKYVKEILGNLLEPMGFEYHKPHPIICGYERMVGEIKQEIWVCRDRYDKTSIMLTLQTNAYGQKPIEFTDWESYRTTEELKEVLQKFKKELEVEGLQLLESISVPTTEARPTPESNRYLYKHHEALAKEYREKLHLENAGDMEILEAIVTCLKEIAEKPFEEVKPMLLGLAALYGEVLRSDGNGEWTWDEERKICWIDKIARTSLGEYVLGSIISSWGKQNHYLEMNFENVMIMRENIRKREIKH